MLMLILFWTDPLNITNMDIPVREHDAVMDKNGDIHVVFTAGVEWNEIDLYYVRTINGDWQDVEMLHNSSLSVSCPKIGIDTCGFPHIVWINWISEYNGRLYYMYRDSSGWSTPENLTDEFGLSYTGICDIVVGRDNSIHVVFSDRYELYYTEKRDSSWSTPVNLSQNQPGVDGFPSIACSDRGVFVAWGNDPGVEDIFYSYRDSSGWHGPINISNTPDTISRYVSINVDRNGDPIVAWEEGHDRYPCFNREPWDNPEIILEELCTYPDVYADNENRPHVIATFPPFGDPQLRDVVLTDSGWVYEVIPDGDVWEPTHPKVVMDSIVHILFQAKYSSDADIDIYYIREGSSGVSEVSRNTGSLISTGLLRMYGEDTWRMYDLSGKYMKSVTPVNGYIRLNVETGIYFLINNRNRIKRVLDIR